MIKVFRIFFIRLCTTVTSALFIVFLLYKVEYNSVLILSCVNITIQLLFMQEAFYRHVCHRNFITIFSTIISCKNFYLPTFNSFYLFIVFYFSISLQIYTLIELDLFHYVFLHLFAL